MATERSGRNHISRRIYFYRVRAMPQASGPANFVLKTVFQRINELPFRDGIDGRYWEYQSGEHLCCWTDETAQRYRLRVATVRTAGLPQIERQGDLSDLSLPTNSGLAETSHVTFFPNDVVGAEFNFFGPRIPRLSGYLWEKARAQSPLVQFQPLLRTSAVAKLDKLGDLTLFRFRGSQSAIQDVMAVDTGLGNAFAETLKVTEGKDLEIVLRPEKRRGKLSQHVRDLAKRAAEFVQGNVHGTAISSLDVRGMDLDTGKVIPVDLLADFIVSTQQVVRHGVRNKSVDLESAYAAIEAAYAQVNDDINTAIGIPS
jgi:hypothetical protein